MKCPWCGKHIKMKRTLSNRTYTNGQAIYYEVWHCVETCGYKKGRMN